MGKIYQLIFYPESGKRSSPYDYLLTLPTDLQAKVYRHLDTIRNLYPQYWQEHVNIKPIQDDLYQLTSGAIRSYICIDNTTLVVVYMCRKVSQKIKRIDLNRAINSMNRYFKED